MKKSKISAVAAIGRNRELGKGGKLVWRIPDDVKRFRDLTRGHPLIMGRKTFESIVSYRGSPLPGRTNIVITRHPEKMIDFVNQSSTNNDLRSRYSHYSDVIWASSLKEAFKKAEESPGSEEIHIGGGAEIYKEALPMIDKLYLTLIDAEAPDADTFFPPYEQEFTKKVFEESHEWNGIKYTYIDLER